PKILEPRPEPLLVPCWDPLADATNGKRRSSESDVDENSTSTSAKRRNSAEPVLNNLLGGNFVFSKQKPSDFSNNGRPDATCRYNDRIIIPIEFKRQLVLTLNDDGQLDYLSEDFVVPGVVVPGVVPCVVILVESYRCRRNNFVVSGVVVPVAVTGFRGYCAVVGSGVVVPAVVTGFRVTVSGVVVPVVITGFCVTVSGAVVPVVNGISWLLFLLPYRRRSCCRNGISLLLCRRRFWCRVPVVVTGFRSYRAVVVSGVAFCCRNGISLLLAVVVFGVVFPVVDFVVTVSGVVPVVVMGFHGHCAVVVSGFATRVVVYEAQEQQLLEMPKDTTQEGLIAAIHQLEFKCAQKRKEQRLVGKVLVDPQNRPLVFLASYSSNISLRWQQGKFIGDGTFGSVYMAVNLDTGNLIAVKEIRFHYPSLTKLYKQVKDENVCYGNAQSS
ncbi:7027_t:CDS:2, partial [Dentiscutata heterogama]